MSNEDFLIPYYNSYSEQQPINFNNNNISFQKFIYYIDNNNNSNNYYIYVFNENKIYYTNFNYNFINDYNENLYGTLFYTFDNNYNIIRTWKKDNICYGILYNNNISNNKYIIFNIKNNIINSFKFNLPDNIDIDNIYLQEFKINDNIYFSFIYLKFIYYFDFTNNSLNNINIIGNFIEYNNEHKYILLPEETTNINIYNFQTKNYNTISISNNQLDKDNLITFSGFYKNINYIDYFYFISFLKFNNKSYFYQYINGEEYISLFNQDIINNNNKLFYIAYIHTFNNLNNDLPIYLILSNNNENNNILSNMYNSIFDYWYLMCNNQYIIININNKYNIYELIYHTDNNNNFIPIDIILNDTSYKFQINKYDYFNIDRFINDNLFYHNKYNDINKFNIENENTLLSISNDIKLSSNQSFPTNNPISIIIKNTNYIIKNYYDNLLNIINQYNINDYIYCNNKFYCISNTKLYIIDNNNKLNIINIKDKIINIYYHISKDNNDNIIYYIYLCLLNNNIYNIYEVIYNNDDEKYYLDNKNLNLTNELDNIYYINNNKYYYYKKELINNTLKYSFYNNENQKINNIIIKDNDMIYNSFSFINLINNLLFTSDDKNIYYIENKNNIYNKILFDNNNIIKQLINYYTYITSENNEDILNIVLLFIGNDNIYYYQILKINKKMLMYNNETDINTINNNKQYKYFYYIMNTIKKEKNNFKYNVHLNNTNYIMKNKQLEEL